MPFKSEKQRRYLWANEPRIAREWTDRYGARHGGIMNTRKGYALGSQDITADSEAVISEVLPGQVNQIGAEKELIQAYEHIMQKFMERFPNIDTENMSVEDMVAMLQLEGVLGTEGAGILSLKEGVDAITPESVDSSTRRISMGDTQWGDIPEELFNKGGRAGYAQGHNPHAGGYKSSSSRSVGGSSSKGKGRQDPMGGYAPDHKYSKTASEMRQLGPQYTSGGNITEPKKKEKADLTKYINTKNITRAKTAYDLLTDPRGALKGNPLALIGILNDIRNWRNKAEVPNPDEITTDEIEEAGGIINFNPSFDYNPTLPGPGIESIDIEDIGVGTGDISNLMTDASTGSPYTTGQDSVLQKHGYDPYEVGTWENQEGLKLLDSLINWNTRA